MHYPDNRTDIREQLLYGIYEKKGNGTIGAFNPQRNEVNLYPLNKIK